MRGTSDSPTPGRLKARLAPLAWGTVRVTDAPSAGNQAKLSFKAGDRAAVLRAAGPGSIPKSESAPSVEFSCTPDSTGRCFIKAWAACRK